MSEVNPPRYFHWQTSADTDALPAEKFDSVITKIETLSINACGAIAVSEGTRKLSYQQLNCQANGLAWRLRALGVRPEQVISVLLPRSPELVIAALSTWKTGAAYLPLDPSYPLERLAYTIQDADSRIVLTSAQFKGRLSVPGLTIIDMDSGWDSTLERNHPLQVPIAPNNLAYVIYTSGSTGRPKGVAVEHASLLNLVRWHQETYAITQTDRSTWIANPAFDASVWEVWSCLASGASLFIPEPELLVSAPRLLEWLVEQEISISFMPTPLAEAVLRLSPRQDLALRALLTGGDTLHRRPDHRASYRVVNHYGPTENTVVATSALVAPEEQRLPPIGVPVSSVRVYLLDSERQPVSPGETGEICLGGSGVARGYLGKPDLTAEKFIPDAMIGIPGARMYRTGDLGQLGEDGMLEFLGRIDQQVKVRGVRIELGEIEAALKMLPAVQDACVLAWGDGAEKKLIAYVVSGQQPAPAQSEIIHDLRQMLPDSMIPGSFIWLRELPITSNGKIDRKALPAPDQIAGNDTMVSVLPHTPNEKILVDIWSEILGVPCGVHDYFLDRDGNSLSALQILVRVREVFGVDLRMQSLFEAPTVAAMARMIEEAHHAERIPQIMAQTDRAEYAPLSFAQQQFWIMDQVDPGNPIYNEQVTIRISGNLSVPSLEKALTEISSRHQVLRASFVVKEGLPFQKLCAAISDLPLKNLEAVPNHLRLVEATRLRREEVLRPFSLSQGPLFRILLIRWGEQEHWLVATFHHAVFDGGSVNVFMQELVALYSSMVAGELLPPLPSLQYADYSIWQRAWFTEPELQKQLTYWRRQLVNVPTLELPTDRPRPVQPTYQATKYSFTVQPEVRERLSTLGKQEGATSFMIILAAWTALIGRFAGERDVPVGTAVAGRIHAELENLIGCFTNTLVMRINSAGNPSFRELLARVRQTALNGFSNQDVPFERVVEELRPQRHMDLNPLFQIAYIFQPAAPESSLRYKDLTFEIVEELGERARFDLELHVWETESWLEGRLLFRTEIFDEQSAKKIVTALEQFLEAGARNPDEKIERLLSAEQEAQAPLPNHAHAAKRQQVDLDRIESLLRRESSVFDCAVLERSGVNGSRQMVAYIVASGPFNPEALAERLAFALPEEQIPSFFVPVSSIPLTSSGLPDQNTLSSIEVIDSDLAVRLEDSLKRIPGISQAAVVLREGRAPSSPVHLADLLPEWRQVVEQGPISGIERSTEVRTADASKPLAVSHGIHLNISDPLPRTLAQAFRRAAAISPRKGIIYLDADGGEQKLSYPELLDEAIRVLAGLQHSGLHSGSKVLLQLPHCLQFVIGFWACQLGGLVPIPAAIPPSYTAENAVVQKLQSAWALLEKPAILCDRASAPAIRSIFEQAQDAQVISIEDCASESRPTTLAEYNPEHLALLLLTSGSTGKPKAVMHSHKTLLQRTAAEVQWNELSSDDISLNWLPLDHVASLVQFHIRDVYLACDEILAATDRILRNILEWLDLIDRFRATVTWAPNFAFGLVNDRAVDIGRRHWDLSSMRNLLNGGEAIVSKTARRFLELLEAHDLPAGALHPVWGMSETAAGVTSSKSFSLATTGLEDGFVDLGEPLPGVSFRIVDHQNQLLKEGTVGRLQVSGSTVTLGYCNAPEQNSDAFTPDGWFKTGDLGYLQNRRLRITGREKNVIIIRGANYYSHEIESVVEQVDGVQISYTAALAVRHSQSDTDELAVFFSPVHGTEARLAQLINEIRERLVRQVGIVPSYLLPIPPEKLPKTSIGKIQHAQLKQQLENGEFNELIKQIDLLTVNANTIPAWFFRKIWRRREAPVSVDPLREGWIVFSDSQGLGDQLVASMKAAGARCVKVLPGPAFRRQGPNTFTVPVNDKESYRRLLQGLSNNSFFVRGVLHLYGYDLRGASERAPGPEPRELERGVYSLLLLIQALAEQNRAEEPVRLLVASSQTQAVRPADNLVSERSACLGLLKTAGQEFSWLACRHIDLPGEAPRKEAELIFTEANLWNADSEVAYREGQRFIAKLEKLEFKQEIGKKMPLRRGGRYLITGGLGGLGAILATYLLREYEAHLLVVGRTPLPERSEWLSHRSVGSNAEHINKLLELERLGGEITYEAGDICDAAKMQQVLASAEARWLAPVDGVFHLAAVARELWLKDETLQGLSSTLAPKVEGTWTLHKLLAGRPQTFFVAFSSVNGFFGGASVGSYAAASSFLDAFCHFQRRTNSGISYCIAWSLWDDLGMSRNLETKEAAHARGYQSISPERGIQSLRVMLSHDLPAVLIGLDDSKKDILKHLEMRDCRLAELCAFYSSDSAVSPEAFSRIQVRDRFNGLVTPDLIQLEKLPLSEMGDVDRAALASMAVFREREQRRTPPHHAVERELASIWKELIKVPEVFLEDGFFDLGGHSLLAIQMLSRLRQRMGVEITIRDLFRASTLGALAALVMERQGGSDHKLEDLVAEIEQLSGDEVHAALMQVEQQEEKIN